MLTKRSPLFIHTVAVFPNSKKKKKKKSNCHLYTCDFLLPLHTGLGEHCGENVWEQKRTGHSWEC